MATLNKSKKKFTGKEQECQAVHRKPKGCENIFKSHLRMNEPILKLPKVKLYKESPTNSIATDTATICPFMHEATTEPLT